MTPGLTLMQDELERVEEPAASPARMSLQKLERYIVTRSALIQARKNGNNSEVIRRLEAAERHDAEMLVAAAMDLEDALTELEETHTMTEHSNGESPGMTVATVEQQSAPRSVGLMLPIAPVADILKAQEATRDLIAQALTEGRDYGKVPGTNKPSLFKAGAERTILAYGCLARFNILEKEIDHERENLFEDRDGNPRRSFGLYRYIVECEIINRSTGEIVGQFTGSASTLESKYVSRPRDSENTVLKMAEKRALVGAALTTFGLSDQFTQDMEDQPHGDPDAGAGEPKGTKPSLDEESCPKCGGRMWDNRLTKRNPRAPDFKCRDRSCDGVIWPAKPGEKKAPVSLGDSEPELERTGAEAGEPPAGWSPLPSAPLFADEQDLPF